MSLVISWASGMIGLLSNVRNLTARREELFHTTLPIATPRSSLLPGKQNVTIARGTTVKYPVSAILTISVVDDLKKKVQSK